MSQQVSDRDRDLIGRRPPPPAAGTPDEPEDLTKKAREPRVLIEEARRRQRRRRAFSALALAAAGGLVAGLLTSSGSPPRRRSGRTTPPSVPATTKTTAGPTTPAGEPATPRSSSELTLLFSSASPLMGVVNKAPSGPGSGTAGLYVTHDFLTYTRISTPTLPAAVRDFSFVSDVTFPTATVGWAVDVAPGSGVYLFETTDGGGQWRFVREVHAEANGAYGWVRFVSAAVGWVGAGDIGSSAPSTLLRTDDGGRSWQALPGDPSIGDWARPSFVTPAVGFLRGTVGPGGSTRLLETTDGGATWSPAPLPLRPAITGAVFPALPKMFGRDGVLPLVVGPQPTELTAGEQPRVTLTFDTTSDGGRAWTARATLPSRAFTGFQTVQSGIGWIAAGPAAAVATPTDWWVLALDKSGKIAVRTTHDAGSTWTTEAGRGLPTIHVASVLLHQGTPLVLKAVTGRIALVVAQTSPSGWSTYVTIDGGAKWSLLTPRAVTLLPATRELLTATVRVSPSKGLADGEKVHVRISGFGADGRYHVSECSSDTAVSEAGCGLELTTQPTVATDGAGKGSATFAVSSSAAASSDTTTTRAQCTSRCVLVVSGGLGHGLAFGRLTFGR